MWRGREAKVQRGGEEKDARPQVQRRKVETSGLRKEGRVREEHKRKVDLRRKGRLFIW